MSRIDSRTTCRPPSSSMNFTGRRLALSREWLMNRAKPYWARGMVASMLGESNRNKSQQDKPNGEMIQNLCGEVICAIKITQMGTNVFCHYAWSKTSNSQDPSLVATIHNALHVVSIFLHSEAHLDIQVQTYFEESARYTQLHCPSRSSQKSEKKNPKNELQETVHKIRMCKHIR